MNNRRVWIFILVLIVLLASQTGCVLLDRLTSAEEGSALSGERDTDSSETLNGQGESPAMDVPGADTENQLEGNQAGQNQTGADQPGSSQANPGGNQNSSPAQNTGCSNGFVLDGLPVHVQGAQYDVNETFEAGWVVQNTGTCTWDSDYELVMIGGDDMGISSTSLQGDTEPGDSITVLLELQAPSQAGTYLTAWKLEDGSGFRFGMDNPANAPLKVKIEVVSTGSSQPELEPFLDLSSFPNVHTYGNGLTMTGNQCFDFEDGVVVSCSDSNADFRYDYAVGQGGELTGLNGTRFSSSFSSAPSEEDLGSAAFYSDPLPLPESGPTGRYYGLTTDMGTKTAYGWILPTACNQGGMTFTFLIFDPDTSPGIAEAVPELNLSMFVLVSEEQETVLVDRCYDLEDGTKASCSGTEADIKYTYSGGTGTLQFLNGAQQNIGDYTEQPDKGTCQADDYMGGYNFIYETPADYNCFTTIVEGDSVYGWYRVTGYNSGGMTFDYQIWTP